MSNNGCWQGNHTEKFSALLAKLEPPRKEIAFRLRIPYSTFDKYVCGYISFPPDLVPQLYEITKDRRVIEFFAEPSGFFLRKKQPPRKTKDDPPKGPDNLIRAAFKAWEVLRNAFDENSGEHQAVHKAIDVLISEAQDVNDALDRKIGKEVD